MSLIWDLEKSEVSYGFSFLYSHRVADKGYI